jgi:hypothetical protein
MVTSARFSNVGKTCFRTFKSYDAAVDARRANRLVANQVSA